MRGTDRADLRDRHAGLREQLEQERLEVVVGAVDLVDQQHRRPRAGVLECAQERAANQIVRTEQFLLAERRAARVGEADAQQLARVVPLVQRLRRVDPLVALQANQRRIQDDRQRLGGLGLADTRLALEQQGLRQAHAQKHRCREALVDEVVDVSQTPGERLDVGHELADLAGRLARDFARSHARITLPRVHARVAPGTWLRSRRSRSRPSRRRTAPKEYPRRQRPSCHRSGRPQAAARLS